MCLKDWNHALEDIGGLHTPDKAREEINGWVAAATNNLINSILPPRSLDRYTAVVLANAIYFKGKWEKPFTKERTEVEKFHLLDGTAVDAPMMRTGRKRFIAVHDGFKVLRLPYRSQDPPAPTSWPHHRQHGTSGAGCEKNDDPVPVPRYSMFVFLPDARDGLWSLVDKIASSPGFLDDHLPEKTVEVGKFRLPKFKTSFSANLTDVLKDMGAGVAFNPRETDLSDMAEDDGSGMPLVLKDVFHKAVVEVNEEGTEAAAVAVCHAGVSAAWRPPPETVDFVTDHPFAFFVTEESSGAVVFAGHVLDPS